MFFTASPYHISSSCKDSVFISCVTSIFSITRLLHFSSLWYSSSHFSSCSFLFLSFLPSKPFSPSNEIHQNEGSEWRERCEKRDNEIRLAKEEQRKRRPEKEKGEQITAKRHRIAYKKDLCKKTIKMMDELWFTSFSFLCFSCWVPSFSHALYFASCRLRRESSYILCRNCIVLSSHRRHSLHALPRKWTQYTRELFFSPRFGCVRVSQPQKETKRSSHQILLSSTLRTRLPLILSTVLRLFTTLYLTI